MIAQLTGKIISSELTSLVLDVNGVGYELSIPLSTFDRLPAPGQTATVKTVMVVRQDDIQLFGFFSDAEKRLFKLLTAEVSGIGPKLALNVLSAMPIEAFAHAIVESDLKLLSKISGVGKRTAERMVVELKDKMDGLGGPEKTIGASGGALTDRFPPSAHDAIAALETLGFKRDAAGKAVQKLLEDAAPEVPSAESLIRKALSVLNT